MTLRRLAPLFVWLALAWPALAQDNVIPAEWSVISNRAEAVLESALASDEAFEDLRLELIDWRERLEDLTNVNAGRIATLRSEIEALGPLPENGTEPRELASRRADLQARLDDLLIPVRAAQAALSRAEGLIVETDLIIESRRSEALLRQEVTPLNPILWAPALLAAGQWFVTLAHEASAPIRTETARAFVLSKGVQIGFLLFVAVLLMLRSGRWLSGLRNRLVAHEATSPMARLSLLLVSVARMGLPVLGVLALTRIFSIAGAEARVIDMALWLAPWLALMVLSARWLANHAFPPRPETPALLPVAQGRRREGRLHAILLGVMFAAASLIEGMVESAPDLETFRGVLQFALAVVTGLTLLRLGQLLLAEGRTAGDDGDGVFWAKVMRLTGRALIVVGLLAPAMFAFGFVNLGMALLWPTVATLGLLVVIGLMQGVVYDAYAALTRTTDSARDALAPTLIGFGLALIALPLFFLIWGVRPQRLLEWWDAFLGGVTFGEFTLSPSNFLTFAVVFAVGYLATRLVKGILSTSVLPKTKLDTGGTNAILSGTGYVGITLASLLAITMAGIDLSGLAIVAGALSVGVGFGLQTIVQNFVSGIILLIERPIKLGDWISAGGVEGFVRQISVRSTRIETFDRQDVIVPNADLIAGVVTNYTLGNSSGRVLVPVGVAYGTDTRRVEAILREITEAHPMVVLNPPPVITFEGFGADSLDFLIRAVLRDVLWKVIVKSEINHAIAERFRDEGIEIPFAQRDVWLRNPEVLQPGPRPQPPETETP